MFLKQSDLSSQKIKSLNLGNIKTDIEDTEYYCQKLYNKKNHNEVFNITNPDFSYFEANNRILIEGPGGQGKSLFYNKLYEKAVLSDNYSDVIIIKLIDLISLTEDDLIPMSSHYYHRCEKSLYITSYLNKNNSISEKLFNYMLNNSPVDKPLSEFL